MVRLSHRGGSSAASRAGHGPNSGIKMIALCIFLLSTVKAVISQDAAKSNSRKLLRAQASCPDTYAACPGWGPGSCGVPGVVTYCPCMCGGTPPPPPAQCQSQPAAVANGNGFSCSLPIASGSSCSTTCLTGYTGTPTATCGSTGSWTVTGSCTTTSGPGVVCSDTYAACPGWGVGSCGVPGVSAYCPCMCQGSGPPASPSINSPPPPPPAPITYPPPPPPPSNDVSLPNTAMGVSYHIYDQATYPDGQVVTQYHTGYNNVDNLKCTDWLKANLNQAQIQQYGWTATIYNLSCGTCVKLRNKRNGVMTTARVVDSGGKGFDLDYQRVFRVMDPDGVNWNRGGMDVDWGTVPC